MGHRLVMIVVVFTTFGGQYYFNWNTFIYYPIVLSMLQKESYVTIGEGAKKSLMNKVTAKSGFYPIINWWNMIQKENYLTKLWGSARKRQWKGMSQLTVQ